MQVTRRSILSVLLSLIPASLLPASKAVLKEQKHDDGVHRWKHYPEPRTAYDAFEFIADHKGRIIRGFEPLTGWNTVTIQIGEYICSWKHECDAIRPTIKIETYYDQYIVPSCIGLYRVIYKRKSYDPATESQSGRS